MCHCVCSVALPVHWHLSGDAASSGDGIFDTHLAVCATVSVQLFYLFTGTCPSGKEHTMIPVVKSTQ